MSLIRGIGIGFLAVGLAQYAHYVPLIGTYLMWLLTPYVQIGLGVVLLGISMRE